MPKTAISVTLESDNLMWLKARARSDQARSISSVLDRLVTDARTGRAGATPRSVVGTIDVDPSDPLLLKADDVIRALVAQSIGRPMIVKEKRSASRAGARKRRG